MAVAFDDFERDAQAFQPKIMLHKWGITNVTQNTRACFHLHLLTSWATFSSSFQKLVHEHNKVCVFSKESGVEVLQDYI